MNYPVESVILYSTTDCNHNCAHCFLGHTGTWDSADLLKTTRQLKKYCNVAINGAEPLLHPDFLDSYAAAEQDYIYSNGIVFLKDDAHELIERIKFANITTIRLSNHFQSCCTLKSVPQTTVERIALMLFDKGLNVEYNSTVTAENYQYLEENCERALQFNIRRIKFFPLIKVGKAETLDDALCLDVDMLQIFYEELNRLRIKYGIDTLELRIGGNMTGVTDKFRCTFGMGKYTIAADKKVYGCPYSISVIPPVGYLTNDGKIIITNHINHDGTVCLVNKLILNQE